MRRLLGCLWYYFGSQRMLPWWEGVGVVMIALGLLTRGSAAASLLLLLGSIAFIGFPILIGGLSFRVLASNRRIAMVPGLGTSAAVALFVLALIGSLLAGVVAAAIDREVEAPTAAALAFASISLYLVLSQWLVTHRWGLAGFFILPILLLRFGPNELAMWLGVLAPWAWLAIAVLAWVWLAIVVRGKRLARPFAGAASLGRSLGGAPAAQERAARPRRIAYAATAAGTLMRGLGDNWPGRLVFALLTVLLMPVVMYAIFIVLGVPARVAEMRQFSGELFLLLSFFGVCFFPAMIFGEWAIRLRLLWLRVAGDRMELWRRLERTLLVDVLLIATVTALVGGIALLVSGLSRELIWLFVLGSMLACAVSTYLTCWARISGWNHLANGMLVAIAVLIPFATVVRLHDSGEALRAFWVLPAVGVLALIAREFARTRFKRMDWCAVRPRRMPRRMI